MNFCWISMFYSRWPIFLVSLEIFNIYPVMSQQLTKADAHVCFTSATFGGIIAGTFLATLVVVVIVISISVYCCCKISFRSKIKSGIPQCDNISKQNGSLPGVHVSNDLRETESLNRNSIPLKFWGLPNALRSIVAHTESDPKYVNELTLEMASDLGFSLAMKTDSIFIKDVSSTLQLSHLRIMEDGEHVIGITIGFQDMPLDVVLNLISLSIPYNPTLYIRKDVQYDLSDIVGQKIPCPVSLTADQKRDRTTSSNSETFAITRISQVNEIHIDFSDQSSENGSQLEDASKSSPTHDYKFPRLVLQRSQKDSGGNNETELFSNTSDLPTLSRDSKVRQNPIYGIYDEGRKASDIVASRSEQNQQSVIERVHSVASESSQSDVSDVDEIINKKLESPKIIVIERSPNENENESDSSTCNSDIDEIIQQKSHTLTKKHSIERIPRSDSMRSDVLSGYYIRVNKN